MIATKPRSHDRYVVTKPFQYETDSWGYRENPIYQRFMASRIVPASDLNTRSKGAKQRTSNPNPHVVARQKHVDISLVGESNVMLELRETIRRVARTNVNVLVTGPTGAGKEVVANAIHGLSPRRDAPFVAVNVGALSRELIESELFGHVRGAFTGAERTRSGRLAEARKGTLLLDEVGDMPLDVQVKLLRVLEQGTYSPVGDNHIEKVDSRIIAATNHLLEQDVRSGRFREDLFWRLNVVHLQVPALADRRADIPLLLGVLLEQMDTSEQLSFGQDGLEVLVDHDWPGNVRELRNIILRALALGFTGTLGAVEVEKLVGIHKSLGDTSEGMPQAGDEGHLRVQAISEGLDKTLWTVSRRLIEWALETTNGSVAPAARLLKIKRSTLVDRLRHPGFHSAADHSVRQYRSDVPGKPIRLN